MSLAQIMYVITCMSPDTDPDTDLRRHCIHETLVRIKKIISKDSEGPGQTLTSSVTNNIWSGPELLQGAINK